QAPALGPHFRFEAGLPGVLGWQPTFLLGDEQWPLYAEVTRGLPLYRNFGSWRGGPAVRGGKGAEKEALPHSKLARRKDRAALARVNAARHQEAEGRRDELVEV